MCRSVYACTGEPVCNGWDLLLLHLPVFHRPACLVAGYPDLLAMRFCKGAENVRACSSILLLFGSFVKTGNLAVLRYSVLLWSHQVHSAAMT